MLRAKIIVVAFPDACAPAGHNYTAPMPKRDLLDELGEEAKLIRRSAARLATIAARDPDHSRSLERASRALIAASDYLAVLQAHIAARQAVLVPRGERKIA